jgi:hypothetical protein
MSTVTVWRGVGLAVLATMAGGVAMTIFPWLIGTLTTMKLVISALTLAYLGVMMHDSQERTGRFATLLLWLTITITLLVANPNLLIWLLVCSAMIWLMRSIYLHRRLISLSGDAVLNAVAVVASVATLLHSHSFWLAIWVFFLIQALHVWIPAARKTRHHTTADDSQHQFEQASRIAETALKRLAR